MGVFRRGSIKECWSQWDTLRKWNLGVSKSTKNIRRVQVESSFIVNYRVTTELLYEQSSIVRGQDYGDGSVPLVMRGKIADHNHMQTLRTFLLGPFYVEVYL